MYMYIINPLENNHIDGPAGNNKVIHFLGLLYDYR